MTPAYAHGPMVLVAIVGQMAFVWDDLGIRVAYNPRRAGNKAAAEARSRRMTRHGKRKRIRAA